MSNIFGKMWLFVSSPCCLKSVDRCISNIHSIRSLPQHLPSDIQVCKVVSPKETELMASEFSTKQSPADNPALASPTPQSETMAPSEAQASDQKTELSSPKMFGSKDYSPRPQQFGDKLSQIPRYAFRHAEHNLNPGGKFGPKKGKPVKPVALEPSPTSVAGTKLMKGPFVTQSDTPAKDPPRPEVPANHPPKSPPPKADPPLKDPIPRTDSPPKDSTPIDPIPHPAQKPAGEEPTAQIQESSDSLEDVQKRPDLHPELQKVEDSLRALSSKLPDNAEVNKILNTIHERLEEIKTREKLAFEEFRGLVKYVENTMVEIKNQPSQEHAHILHNLDILLEKANSKAIEESKALERVQTGIEELNKRPQIDDTEALQDIAKSLDIIKNRPLPIDYSSEIKLLSNTVEKKMEEHMENSNTRFEDVTGEIEALKSRPALNNDFDSLRNDVFILLEMVSKEDTTIVAQLQDINKILNERPGLNINRDEIFDRLKTIQHFIQERPPVKQKEILDGLEFIQKKCESIDFAGVFTDLRRIEDKVEAENRRAIVSPNEMRQAIQGVHDNIDEVKKNPVMTSKPLVTQEHFDRTLGPMADTLSDLASDRDRGKAILDVVQNVHHGVVETIRRPAFNLKPITDLSRLIEANHNDDRKSYENIEAKLDGIVLDDESFGTQMKAMRGEFREALESDKVHRETSRLAMEKKMDTLTKMAEGALIVSAVTAIGFFGWSLGKKLFGGNKKDEEEREQSNAQAVNKKKIGKRLHARSWNQGSDLLVGNCGGKI
jgi:hypothetical protein